MKFLIFLTSLGPMSLSAGPYAPAPGSAGTQAVASDDSSITRWAEKVVSYLPGEGLDEAWQDSSLALGPAGNDATHVVSLGRGGRIVLEWIEPIVDRPGADFVVFENGFGDGFLELAYVEVSSDGQHFVRYPNDSQTSGPVGGFATLDPTDVTGLASKYRLSYGTPFDLAEIPDSEHLDRRAIRFIRLIDIVGDGRDLDSSGDPIYDPYPTFSSAGFDLDALGIIGPAPLSTVESGLQDGQFHVRWRVRPGQSYEIEENQSLDPEGWTPKASFQASGDSFLWSQSADDAAFYRLREIQP